MQDDRKSRAPIKLINWLISSGGVIFIYSLSCGRESAGINSRNIFYRTDHRHSSTTRSGAQRFDGPGLIFATSKRDANVFLSSGRKEERWRPPRFCRQPSEKLSARIATRSIIPSFSSGVWTGAKARRGGILVRAHIATREILGQCAFARISIFDTFNAHSTLVSLSLARSSLHGDRSIVTADLLFFFPRYWPFPLKTRQYTWCPRCVVRLEKYTNDYEKAIIIRDGLELT